MIHHEIRYPMRTTPQGIVIRENRVEYKNSDLSKNGCLPEMLALIGLGKIKNEGELFQTLSRVPIPSETDPDETWVENALKYLALYDTILDPTNYALTMMWP
jgi:hypothetical protein